jgi:hypothetical protein
MLIDTSKKSPIIACKTQRAEVGKVSKSVRTCPVESEIVYGSSLSPPPSEISINHIDLTSLKLDCRECLLVIKRRSVAERRAHYPQNVLSLHTCTRVIHAHPEQPSCAHKIASWLPRHPFFLPFFLVRVCVCVAGKLTLRSGYTRANENLVFRSRVSLRTPFTSSVISFNVAFFLHDVARLHLHKT